MENSGSPFPYEWEYYYGYLDPVIVDATELKYNKYSVVIIFWMILAAFVCLLFLSLSLLSGSWSLPRCRGFKKKGRRERSAV